MRVYGNIEVMTSEKVQPPTVHWQEPVNLIRVAAFALFLAPISIVIGGDGVSANYLFILLLLFAKGYRQNFPAFIYLMFMFFSWFLGMAIFSGGNEHFIFRQSVSFGIALAAVLLLFIHLRVTLCEIQLAIAIAAVIYSIFVVVMIAMNGFSLADIYFIKGGLREYVPDWPQRFVVVLLMAIFICFERLSSSLLWVFAFLVILLCIFLTFTRAAWIGLAFGFMCYLPVRLFRKKRVPAIKNIFRVIILLVPIVSAPFLLPEIGNALQRIWSTTSSVFSILSSGDGFDVEGSEGTRVEIWSNILKVLISNPFTGSGFAGASLMLEGAGSAHSQYLDVLLRTGVLGLVFYLYFWSKAIRFYSRRSIGVMAGLAAIFAFGFFHETTKLSYGALILFSLLNKAYEEEKGYKVVIAIPLLKKIVRG